MAGAGIRLGAFELVRPIGKGGMADVWLGVHRAQDTRVAIKVLTGARAREPAYTRALNNEIENVARLHHPGIVLLFDSGTIDDEAEAQSNKRLVSGSPWFAMELASHGALSPKRLPLPWGTARMLLLSLLDALSHAHARGVIHRDLKPGNILLCAPDDPRPGLKLSDFGIAAPLMTAMDDSVEQGRLSGTPRYMAPEQFQARWRDFGPWTDLYAMGCIAYQLATGRTPFGGDALRLAIAHCHDAPDKPIPTHAGYPSGFDAWVLRLLEKEPMRRFLCAADAAWALLKLAAPGVEDEVTIVAGWEDALRSLKPRPIGATGGTGGTGGPSLTSATGGNVPTGPTQSGESDSGAIRDPLKSGPPRRAIGLDEPAEEGPDDEDVVTLAGRKRHDPAEEGPANASLHIRAATLSERPHARDTRRPRDDDDDDDEQDSANLDPADATLSGSSVFTRVQVRPRRGALASLSSEASGVVPERDPRAARGARRGDPREPDDERDYPRIGGDETRRGTKLMAEQPDLTSDGDVPPPLVETTFAPNVPWTELAALSPRESMPTLTARADAPGRHDPGTRRRELIDEHLLAPRLPPPMPPTWRRPDPHLPSTHLLGVGLGLYGLRQIPLVDRDFERDLVWDTLRNVHQGRGARVVVLRGPAGIGKTRLCEWLIERGAEVGAAVAVRAGHGPGGGPLDGVSGLVALHARALGLRGRELVARLRQVVVEQGVGDRDEALALAELLEPSGDKPGERRPSTDGGEDRVRLQSDRERHAVALRYLARVAADRPVVAWFDDVQWGNNAIAFARHVVEDESASQVPVLLLLSATEEALGERPAEAHALEDLVRNVSDRVVEIRLPHLPARDHKELVVELLGLEERLAEMVAERTAGNPLFAVTLVGDFVARGVLELTPEGFALKRGERAIIPESLFSVWSERLDRALLTLPKDSRTALELGSVLGTSGDDGEWAAICSEAGVDLSPALVDEMVRARLLVDDEAGLRFAHAMLRESTLRTAAEGGRLEDHHRTAARMLLRRYSVGRRGVAERVGRHLVAAGDLEGALPHLLGAALEAGRSASYADAHAFLGERDAVLERLGLAETDPRRVEGWAIKASVLVDEGRFDEAGMWADLVLHHRADPDVKAMVPSALRVRAQIALRWSDWNEASARFQEAIDAAEKVGDTVELTQSLAGLADASLYRGHLQESGEVLARALEVCTKSGDDVGVAFCLWNSAYVALWRGDPDGARQMLLRQQKLARRAGHRSMIANGKNALGDVDRMIGKYDEAEGRYEDALRLFVAIGSGKRRSARINLAMNSLARGQLEKAKQRAEELLPEVEKTGEKLVISLCHGVLAAVCAHEEKWRQHDRHVSALRNHQRDSGLVDGDHAVLFEMIGDHARARGDDERAVLCYEEALRLWHALGRADRASIVELALGKLGTVPRFRRPPTR